jgi:putative hydrolase of the HAD superfamily
MSAADYESTNPGIQAEFEQELARLRLQAGEGSREAINTLAQWLKKLGPRLAEIVPSSRFDVVLFDVGGVLLTNGWDHIERAAVLEQFSLDKQAFESRHPDPYDALERDTISMLDYLNATVFYEPRSFSPDEFIATMKLQSLPLADNAICVLAEIASSRKFLVGVLNNESRLLHEYRMQKYDLAQHLDVQLSSPYLALRKPEPAIYRRALDILGRPGNRVIFIDDRKGNTDAAAATGMHAIQFLGEQKLRFDLQQLGIL